MTARSFRIRSGLVSSACALFLLAGALSGSGCSDGDSSAPPASAASPAVLTVAAASSLRELLESTKDVFARAHGNVRLTFSFDASSTLARQIEEGAPFDVFLSADAATVDKVASSVRAATRRNVLGNKLVLIGRADLAQPPGQPSDLVGSRLSLAVAGPAVPAGKYARACLQKLDLLDDLERRFVNGDSVKSTLALVDGGTADCGFVYLTDARGSQSARLLWTAPPEADPGIVYVAAVLQRSSSPLAEPWVAWLGSAEFLQAAQALGFLPPP